MGKVWFEKNGQLQVVRPVAGEALPVESVGGGSGDGAILDGVSGTIKATVRDYLNSNPIAVVLTDLSGDSYIAGAAAGAATGTMTTVGDSATAVSLLASNAARKGAVITNDSSAVLFVGLSATDPTTTLYTATIGPGQTWELKVAYTGQIKGIWASDPNDGAARITELT